MYIVKAIYHGQNGDKDTDRYLGKALFGKGGVFSTSQKDAQRFETRAEALVFAHQWQQSYYDGLIRPDGALTHVVRLKPRQRRGYVCLWRGSAPDSKDWFAPSKKPNDMQYRSQADVFPTEKAARKALGWLANYFEIVPA